MVSATVTMIGNICLIFFVVFLFLGTIALVVDSDFLGVLSLIGLLIFFIAGIVFNGIGNSLDEVGIYHTDEKGIEQLITEYSKNPKVKITYKDKFKEGSIVYEVYEYSNFKGEYEIVIINYKPKEISETEKEIDFSSYAED